MIKPLVGREQVGPSDASVIRPKMDSFKGIAIGCGLCPQVSDPYRMAVAAIDEAVRNVISIGAPLEQIALLDNFCWPSVDDEQTMGTLVRACEACRDVALAFGTPFISGKDSLHNQFTDSETGRVTRIPATLLISAISVVADVRRCVTMDFKRPGATVVLISARNDHDLHSLAATHRLVQRLIASGRVSACHDVSDGGIATTLAEMCIASGFGIDIDPEAFIRHGLWDEKPGRYVVEVRGDDEFRSSDDPGVTRTTLGIVLADSVLKVPRDQGTSIAVKSLKAAWRGTLDW